MLKNWIGHLLEGWDASRTIRLILGGLLTIGGILYNESILIVLGVWLLLQSILNISCCGVGGCSVSGGQKPIYKDMVKPYKPKK
ncbi:MAG: hypothetical protein I3J02_08695 [Prevotella sp.]|nr:hypothetical protein [Prevotella sp.]